MTAELRRPDRRECELCGRREVWDEAAATWRIAGGEDGAGGDDAATAGEAGTGSDDDANDGDAPGDDRQVGDPFCIHEWDINGTFSPFGD